MRQEDLEKIAGFEGIEFIKKLLEMEERRFKKEQFSIGSTFEDINADFGIFPSIPAYPVYFAGDIRSPENKIVVIGINPGLMNRNMSKSDIF